MEPAISNYDNRFKSILDDWTELKHQNVSDPARELEILQKLIQLTFGIAESNLNAINSKESVVSSETMFLAFYNDPANTMRILLNDAEEYRKQTGPVLHRYRLSFKHRFLVALRLLFHFD
jgi:4-hydroxyphenylpyruvate dioxygenase-like putative hemolysin